MMASKSLQELQNYGSMVNSADAKPRPLPQTLGVLFIAGLGASLLLSGRLVLGLFALTSVLYLRSYRRSRQKAQPITISLEGHTLKLCYTNRSECLDLRSVHRQMLLVTPGRQLDHWYYALVLNSGLVVKLFEQGTFLNETDLLQDIGRATGLPWLRPRMKARTMA